MRVNATIIAIPAILGFLIIGTHARADNLTGGQIVRVQAKNPAPKTGITYFDCVGSLRITNDRGDRIEPMHMTLKIDYDKMTVDDLPATFSPDYIQWVREFEDGGKVKYFFSRINGRLTFFDRPNWKKWTDKGELDCQPANIKY